MLDPPTSRQEGTDREQHPKGIESGCAYRRSTRTWYTSIHCEHDEPNGGDSVGKTLFSQKNLGDLIRNYPSTIQGEIDGWERNKVLAVSESDLIDYLVSKYTLDAPSLLPRDHWESVADEAMVDVSHDPMRTFLRDDGRAVVPGHRVSVRVPFDGDADLFEFQPTTHTFNPPQAVVSEHDRVLTFDVTVPHDTADGEAVGRKIDRQVSETESHLAWVRKDCEDWNQRLPGVAADCLNSRKSRLLKQADLLGQLGIPLKRRDDEGGAFAVPIARRTRPSVRLPATPSEAFQAEPTIAESDYNFILELISRLAVNIERNPVTFVRLPEEHIRNLILVSLNSHFDGGATGETFNANGKTDILIREGDENAFIAECKFWSGPKGLHRAINQLLNYATWRDTKTALILFCRNKDFGAVLESIAEHVPEHPSCKRMTRKVRETEFRYVFGQMNDANREVHLAVLAFNIPLANGA